MNTNNSFSRASLVFGCLALLAPPGCTSATGIWSGECVEPNFGWSLPTVLDLTDDAGTVTGTMAATGGDGVTTWGDAYGTLGIKHLSLTVGVGIVNYTDSDTFEGKIVEDSLDGDWLVSGYAGSLDLSCALTRSGDGS